MKPTRVIINRQKAAFNRKNKEVLPEEPTISIHRGREIDYAYAIRLSGDWVLKQDYAHSPCSGAHIWLESTPTSELEITHRRPLSENAVNADELPREHRPVFDASVTTADELVETPTPPPFREFF